MINPQGSYLKRLKIRKEANRLEKLVVFGYGIGIILTLWGGSAYFFTMGLHDYFYFYLMLAGLSIMVTTLFIPEVVSPLESLWMFFALRMGKTVFSLLLLVIYFVFFMPVGFLIRRSSGADPFYSWNEMPPASSEGWIVKKPTDTQVSIADGSRKYSQILQAVHIFSYFAKDGQYLVIPVLLFLLMLGLIMFFVQTSTLAPFIYTLF